MKRIIITPRNNDNSNSFSSSKSKSTSHRKSSSKDKTKTVKNYINYQNYLYDENDTFDTLVVKNDNLRLLLVQANKKLNEFYEHQSEVENDFKLEKQSILQQLDKISNNYMIYAHSHKVLKETEKKMNHIIQCYSNLNEELSRSKQMLNDVINNYYETFENINDFIASRAEKESGEFNNKIEFFSYMINLRNKMYENYNKMCNESNIVSLKKKNNSKLNSNSKRSNNNTATKRMNSFTRKSKTSNNSRSKRDLNEEIYSDFNCQLFSNIDYKVE